MAMQVLGLAIDVQQPGDDLPHGGVPLQEAHGAEPVVRVVVGGHFLEHDGSKLVLKKVAADYDAHDRLGAMSFLQRHAAVGQVVTGLLYVDREPEDLHRHFNTVEAPLNSLSDKELCPGAAALEKINASLR